MVQSPGVSPTNRRRSIAVLNIEAKSQTTRRRRAHSMAGDKLSPYARSRRSLGPRKSILKRAPITQEEEDVTQAMDLTTALSRRVSFAKEAHVRLFEIQRAQNTNSTEAPSSSPPPEDDQPPINPPPINDENAYPGAVDLNHSRRRSSRRRSAFSDVGGGEESMELDMDDIAPTPYSLFPNDENFDEGAEQDNFYDDEDFGGSDMEMTEIIRRKSMTEARRRSSLGRSKLPPPPEDLSLEAASDVSGESYPEHEEFLMPLGKSLREPSPPPDEWHRLRAMTHAGNLPASDPPEGDPNDDDDMDLRDAMNRLRKARDSLAFVAEGNSNDSLNAQSDGGDDQGHKDLSFASTDSDSFADELPGQDKTINVTEVLRRASFAGGSSQLTASEFGSQKTSGTNSTDIQVNNAVNPLPEKSSIYPDLTEFTQSTPPVAPAPVFQKSTPVLSTPVLSTSSVFSKPPSAPSSSSNTPNSASTPKAHPARPSVFSTKPPAPSMTDNPPQNVAAEDTAPSELFKRPVSATGVERPSPAKKQAVSRLSLGTPSKTPVASSSKLTKDASKSPGKPTTPAKSRVSSVTGTRRTSAAFPQRKSLGGPASVAFGSKVAGKAAGRKSAPGDIASPSKSPSKAKFTFTVPIPNERSESPACEREVVRQAIAVPSPSRGSPMPGSPQIASLRPASPQVIPSTTDYDPPAKAKETRFEEVSAPERWRDEVQDEEQGDDEEGPSISIEQFLAMTGIKFMDELAAPRRSTILPSMLSGPTFSESVDEVPLADFVVAQSIDLPQWMLYAVAVNDLQNMIDAMKEHHRQAEEEVEKDTPALFREFAEAEPDLKEELLHQLKLIKANNHGLARSAWYDIKMFWLNSFYESAEQGFARLESDAAIIDRINQDTQELLPALREEYEAVMAASEKEALEVAEIEECDQKYLSELKSSIAEQSLELEAYRADVAETTAKLDRLKERSAEIEAEEAEVLAAIADCERMIQIQKNSTKEEVFQLKEKLDALQELHLWRATNISSDMAQFVYASRYTVSIPCIKFKPVPSGITISRLPAPPNKRRDPFPELSELAMQAAQTRVSTMKGQVTHRQILQDLSDFWTSMIQLRSQLDVLAIKFPVKIESPLDGADETSGFKAVANVLFTKHRAKALIKFVFDSETFSSWPMSLASVGCEVEVVYGTLNSDGIRASVLGHIAEVSLENLHGLLLDACADAVAQS